MKLSTVLPVLGMFATQALAATVCFDPLPAADGTSYTLCFDNEQASGVELTIGADVAGDLNTVWVFLCATIVFLMQAGFMMVEAGSVSEVNVQNIIFKNLMDAAIGALSFWSIGYGVAYGSDSGQFIGTDNFFITEFENGSGDWVFWFFQFVFAATAATIVSGCVAERCQMKGYFAYSIILTMWIYPVVVHWVWADGFLSAFRETNKLFDGNGLVDFAGSGVVHMVGGIAGLVATIKMGPRRGRFAPDGTPRAIKGHSDTLVAQGVLILWFGWYGFNSGSTLAAAGGNSNLAAKVAVVTTISACAASLTVLAINVIKYDKLDVMRALNGVLAGLVSITAPCSVVDPWHAFLIGVTGGVIYELASRTLLRFQIDDPVDASPIHGACGIWGVLSVFIFATKENLEHGGYDGVTGGTLVATQIVGVLAILAWTIVQSFLLFTVLDKLDWLRVAQVSEVLGLDVSEHGNYDMMAELASAATAADRNILTRMVDTYLVYSGDTTNAKPSKQLGATELGRLRYIFDMMDVDHKGFVTKVQYRNTLKHIGLGSKGIQDTDLAKIFFQQDTMSFESFEKLLSQDLNTELTSVGKKAEP